MSAMYEEKNIECVHCHKVINNVEVPNYKEDSFNFQCPLCNGWFSVDKEGITQKLGGYDEL